MLRAVKEQDRERERQLRRLERDRRRREAGQQTYFDETATFEAWPLLTDSHDQPTMIVRAPLRRSVEEITASAQAVSVGVEPALTDASPEAGARRRRLAVSTAIFSVATGLSRMLGLVREVVAAYYFGAAGKINAFTVAFQVPNLVRALVADAALSSAFVPVFSGLLETGERKRAWRVASSLFWLMLLGLTGLTAIFILIAPWVIGLFGNPGDDKELAIGLSRVLFPIVTLLGLTGIVVGILNSYDHFTVPALSPVFWNLAIILGLVLGVPHASTENGKLYVYAFAIVIGTLIQLLLPLPWLRGIDEKGEHLRVLIDWHDPAVWRVFKLMVPVTLGLGLINFNAVIDSAVASRLIDPTLAPTAIEKAFRLYMLPQGMFSVAIATVLFPSLSRLAARGDIPGFRATVDLGLRQIAFLLVPASVAAAVLAEPMIRLIYQHGKFAPSQTPVVAAALAAFAAGLTFNGTMLMLNRAFFSLQSNWIPTMVALGNLVLNLALDLAFYHLGTWGIPLSTTVVNIAGTGFLYVLLQRELGVRLASGDTAATVAKVVVASALVAAVAYGAWDGLDHALGRSLAAQIVSVGFALGAATGAYLLAARVLRIREVNALLSLGSRFRRA
jgi:putative peptidoglycan lipid II flippase